MERNDAGSSSGLAAEYSRQGSRGRLGTSERVALGFFALSAGYFLWTEHRAHVVQYLPWVILALCPLMHLFMHRGHGHGSANSGRVSDEEGQEL